MSAPVRMPPAAAPFSPLNTEGDEIITDDHIMTAETGGASPGSAPLPQGQATGPTAQNPPAPMRLAGKARRPIAASTGGAPCLPGASHRTHGREPAAGLQAGSSVTWPGPVSPRGAAL